MYTAPWPPTGWVPVSHTPHILTVGFDVAIHCQGVVNVQFQDSTTYNDKTILCASFVFDTDIKWNIFLLPEI